LIEISDIENKPYLFDRKVKCRIFLLIEMEALRKANFHYIKKEILNIY